MGATEIYSYVLADCFMTALILPVQGDVAIVAMRIFGGYNMYLAVSCAVFGAFLAVVVNTYIGVLIRIACKFTIEGEPKNPVLVSLIGFAQKSGHFIMLFAWIPVIGGLYAAMVGFSDAPLKKALPYAAFGYAVFYSLTNLI